MNFIDEKSNEQKKITVSTPYGYGVFKRLLDIILSSLGLLILLPVLIMVSIMIKVEDRRGTVFFVQTRVGKNGKHFKMYKFRSMVSNAEDLLEDLLEKNEVSGAMFKMKSDPRITSIGKFIRKTSIDELPQLINVLKGDMSLVGPRPPLPREVNDYTAYQKQRLEVIPGCTGVWQAGQRNAIGFEEMVELDLFYIENRRISYDLYLIIKTVFKMAYPPKNSAH